MIENRHAQPSDTATGKKPVKPAVSCCGGPAPEGVDACCVRDAEAKASGSTGCGCAAPDPQATRASACRG